MPRGRPRKLDPSIPAHIDQRAIPRGIYWDRSGSGRWYVRNADGTTRSIADRTARLSDLHAVAEQRAGAPVRGTIARVLDAYHAHREYRDLAATTRAGYAAYAAAIKSYPTKHGPLGAQVVDRLAPPVFRALIDRIADGRPADGDHAAIPGHPTKANHWLRYLRRAFGWGIEHGECSTNPCKGVSAVPERAQSRMPTLVAFRAVQAYARAAGAHSGREKGKHPRYLWAAMVIAYQVRLRGIEVLTLTDAHVDDLQLQTNRRKGSRDNVTRIGPQLQAALADLREYRAAIWSRRHRQIPIRPQDRPLFVSESGDALTRAGFHCGWGKMMRAAVAAGIITPAQRFALHGLKHRGITDTQGGRDAKRAGGGHKTDAMLDRYDHELPVVAPTADAAE